MTAGEGSLSIITTALPYAALHVQAQNELLKHKAHAAELAQKLAEDVATTEELQRELAVLEDEFNAVKKGRAGQQTAMLPPAVKVHTNDPSASEQRERETAACC